jgi:hypothetical protein
MYVLLPSFINLILVSAPSFTLLFFCTFRESEKGTIIPGLPDDLGLRCLAKMSHGHHGLLETVSKRWRDLIRSSDYAAFKAREGWCGDWLFVLTDGSSTEWVAYDPQADTWHPLPKISTSHPECEHFGFSCVCVCNRLLVIGGSYKPLEPEFPNQRPFISNDVMQFDPYKKQWTSIACMRTPRSHFACSVIGGKVYVAGGRNSSCTRGLALAEVYDPLTDKYVHMYIFIYVQVFKHVLELINNCHFVLVFFLVFASLF